MNLPPNMTEQEVVDTIDVVVNRLARKFIFGYHDVDDMKQQGRLFALECLKSYDNKRPLENFLWTHVRNRLFNYKRDKYERPQLPCFKCEYRDPEYPTCLKYADDLECVLYESWYTKNSAKKNIMAPLEFDQVQPDNEVNMSVGDDAHDNAVCNELTETIEQNLSVGLRADYLRIKNNIKIPKCRKDKVQDEIVGILAEYGYGDITRDITRDINNRDNNNG